MDEMTTITVRKITRKRLADLGTSGDSLDDVLTMLINFYQKETSKLIGR